jgi:hypothetical protein
MQPLIRDQEAAVAVLPLLAALVPRAK